MKGLKRIKAKRQTPQDDPLLVAYHEAGHAVVALAYELPFDFIELVPHSKSRRGAITRSTSEAKVVNAMQVIQMQAGGLAATMIAKDKYDWSHLDLKLDGKQFTLEHWLYLAAGNDFENCLRVIHKYMPELNAQVVAQDAYQRAQRLLTFHWSKVELLAGALVQKKRLTFAECEQLYFDQPVENNNESVHGTNGFAKALPEYKSSSNRTQFDKPPSISKITKSDYNSSVEHQE